jgi:phosphoserine phosphatase
MREVVAFDVEGTLSTGAQWKGVGRYLVGHGRALAYRLFFLARIPSAYLARFGVIAEQPFRDRWIVDLARLLRGLTDAELTRLGEWVVERELWPARRTSVLAELAGHVAAGRRVALISAMYQPVIDALARVLGAEAHGTSLEMRDGTATGAVGAVNSGAEKGRRLRDVIDGDTLVASYGDTFADLAMLQASASPVAVAPDRTLLRVALARGWRIIPS